MIVAQVKGQAIEEAEHVRAIVSFKIAKSRKQNIHAGSGVVAR